MKTFQLFIAFLYGGMLLMPASKPSLDEVPSLIINEILFNPRPDGVDYIELYNRSNTPIDLNGWRIANRNSLGVISSSKLLASRHKIIPPDSYLVITEDSIVVQRQYTVKDIAAFLPISSMPSFPDAAGTVVLLNAQNNVEDELAYNSKWHFTLISKPEGVALERINPNSPTQDPSNWHSASTTSGYGTPTYKNSQYYNNSSSDNAISVEPSVFSPDSDGYNDYLLIKYKLPAPGYLCNMTLFSSNGIPIRYLVRNGLCGSEGYYKWDGLNENGSKVRMGSYILLAELFNVNGHTMKSKHVVTVAGKR